MQIGGLDIGTTGCKLTVFNETGERLGKAYREYPVTGTSGSRERDAGVILDSVWKVIKEMTAVYSDIAGMGVTSFGETFVMTDRAGNPLYPSMLYTDPRGREQCGRLCRDIGEEKLAEISGTSPHEMYSISKIMWVKENRPDVYAKAEHILLMEDFVVFRLTGQAKIDYSLAARTMGFDIRKLKWSRELFDAAGVDLSLMSETVPSGSVAGTVLKSVAAETGLNENTKIVCISHDQVAAAVGAGVFDPDSAVDGAGTVQCITPVYDGIPDMKVMARGKYAVIPYVVPGKYVCYAFSNTGGELIRWFTDTLAKKEKEEAKAAGITVNEFLESRSESPTGLLVLPHFAGAGTPYMDTGSRGVIAGLTTASTAADIYRGCMEGVVYEMLVNMEYLKDSGIRFRRLFATGGGARSAVWMQMKADILNMPVTSLLTADAGTVGSAMLTGIAAGCFKDLPEAAGVMVREDRTFEPDSERHSRYMDIYGRYREIYPSIRKLM